MTREALARVLAIPTASRLKAIEARLVEVLYLVYAEGLTSSEIAARVDVSAARVRQVKAQALSLLREAGCQRALRALGQEGARLARALSEPPSNAIVVAAPARVLRQRLPRQCPRCGGLVGRVYYQEYGCWVCGWRYYETVPPPLLEPASKVCTECGEEKQITQFAEQRRVCRGCLAVRYGWRKVSV